MLQVIHDANTYRIVHKIADGGMGSVYQAIQDGVDGFQKIVALKTLLPELTSNQRFIDMFVQEAKLVANLVHENIVQIYQLGKSADGYYIVMEFVHGLSLFEFLRFHETVLHKPLPQELAVFIASRIARGLAYAHARTDTFGRPLKIVHRDVCPNNIMITTEGLPKLTDFGIARVSLGLDEALPQLVGKLTYMPPQQARRESVDCRADLFSLGAVLFEMLGARKIRSAADAVELEKLAMAGQVEWDLLPADVAPDVRAVLERCLQADPGKRYPAAGELAQALEYHIYKDGYGPTIQTLETYLRQQFPYLYRITSNVLAKSSEFKVRHGGKQDATATIVLDKQDRQKP